MKTSNFISLIGHPSKTRLDFVFQILVSGLAILLASSLLIASGSGNYEKSSIIGLVGISLFTIVLTRFHSIKRLLLKNRNRHLEFEESEELEYINPVIITQFGKQNVSNNPKLRKAA